MKRAIGPAAVALLVSLWAVAAADADEKSLTIWWAQWDPAAGLQELSQDFSLPTAYLSQIGVVAAPFAGAGEVPQTIVFRLSMPDKVELHSLSFPKIRPLADLIGATRATPASMASSITIARQAASHAGTVTTSAFPIAVLS